MYNFFKKNKEEKKENELNNLPLYLFITLLVIYELVILFFIQQRI